MQDANDTQDLAVRVESSQRRGPPCRLRRHKAKVHFARLPWEKLEGALLCLLVEAAQKLQVNLPKQALNLQPGGRRGSKPCRELQTAAQFSVLTIKVRPPCALS